MIEPNCDMPWDIYLDWLQDQGNQDLRFIDIGFFCGDDFPSRLADQGNGSMYGDSGWGNGLTCNHGNLSHYWGCGIDFEGHSGTGPNQEFNL